MKSRVLSLAVLLFAPTQSAAQSPAQAPAAKSATAEKTAAAELPKQAAPKVPASEREHVAVFDSLIAPARDHAISIDDATRIRDAIAAAKSSPAQAKALRDAVGDPTGRKLIDWYLYRGGVGTAREILAFAEKNPAWPERALLFQRAEEAVFTGGGSAREIKAFFEAAGPRSGAGYAALASAHLADKDEAGAKRLAAKAWRELDMPSTLETGFLERFGRLLTEADHKWRLDRLLSEDKRWVPERNEKAPAIRRTIALLSASERPKAEARLAVYLRSKQIGALLAAPPTEGEGAARDWGLALQRAQHLRRSGKPEEAARILLEAPTDPAKIAGLDGWWEQRELGAYDALRAGNPRRAYDLVKSPGPLSVNPRKDAAFLAGWLAFRHLDDAGSAERHFLDLEAAADGPLSRARAGYWLGRVYEAKGQKDKAEQKYRAAAAFADTFHGLLARRKLDPGSTTLRLAMPARPSAEEAARFNGLDAVRAVVIARRAGLDIGIRRSLLAALRNHLQTEAELAMLAHLAEALGDTQSALRTGKVAVARGHNLTVAAYPIHPLPQYTPLRTPPEPAFLLSIGRQESEFDASTLSGAGARGLLQVMPITARHVCRDYRIKCEIDRLMRDTAYNTMMASAYIGDRMDEFAGSYVLTLAGYNAGPGRARQWMREFGDPRDPKIDPIDWIHRIPIEETREYVQKVLANIQIYRARLGEEATALRIDQDLRRVGTSRSGRAAAVPKPSVDN